MKVAIIGRGKTGKAILDFLKEDEISDVFDSQNLVTVEKLNKATVAIVFVSADVLRQILPVLLQSKVSVICGTTGFHYDQTLIQRIRQSGQTWVVATLSTRPYSIFLGTHACKMQDVLCSTCSLRQQAFLGHIGGTSSVNDTL